MQANMEWVKRQRMMALGSGVYATVYTMRSTDDFVIKQARMDDGTRNWLEFCKARQDIGMGHPLMPTVVALWDIYNEEGERGYIAILERLELQKKDACGYCEFECPINMLSVDGYVGMSDAFAAYVGVRGCAFNDLHSGNIMMRGHQPVITDPSCMDYTTFINHDHEFFI